MSLGCDFSTSRRFRNSYRHNLLHVGRTLDYDLRDKRVVSLARRNNDLSEVIDEVFHPKNPVAEYRPDEEFAASVAVAGTTERIEMATRQVDQEIINISQLMPLVFDPRVEPLTLDRELFLFQNRLQKASILLARDSNRNQDRYRFHVPRR